MKQARHGAGLVLGLAVVCGTAWADEADVTITPRTHFSVGAGYGGPLGPAGTVELLYGLGADVREDGERVNARFGPLLQLHAGAGGGKLSLGVGAAADLTTDDFHGPAGAALKLSLVRTWRSTLDDATERTYLGPELEFSVRHINVGLGVLTRLAGTGGHRVRFAWDLGVRF